MRELVLQWYILLGSLNAAVALPLRELAETANFPILTALLFGLIGATSPCQLTTSASAAAFLAKDGSSGPTLARRGGAFVAAKVVVYTLLGLLVAVAGEQLSQASIPMAVLARKVLGPVMILVGLHLLGLVPERVTAGAQLSAWLEAKAGGGSAGAFVLGLAFACAFCPTLFLLYFGLTVPMMWTLPDGLLFPAVFALGTVLPLLSVLAVLGLGLGKAGAIARRVRNPSRLVSRLAGAVFLLAGLNDTIVYWLL